MTPHQRPCPDCARHDRDEDGCKAIPACVTHRGVRHLTAWGVCPDCVAAVDRMLADLLELHAMAPDHLEPSRGGSGGPSSERPIGVNVAALDLAHGESLLGVLEDWERFIREEFGLAPYGEASALYASRTRENGPGSHATPGLGSTATSRTLTGVVGFLRAQWPVMAAGMAPPPDEFAHEVRVLHRQALAALSMSRFDMDPDPDAKEPPAFTIACPTHGCGATLGVHRAPRRMDGMADHVTSVDCPRCGAHRTTAHLLEIARTGGTRVTGLSKDEVCAYLGTTDRGLAVLIRAGRVTVRAGRYVVCDTPA